jgi:hypothetical protein
MYIDQLKFQANLLSLTLYLMMYVNPPALLEDMDDKGANDHIDIIHTIQDNEQFEHINENE